LEDGVSALTDGSDCASAGQVACPE
jgi:hypothetical protein